MCISDELYVGNLFTQLNYGKDGKKYANLNAVKSTLEQAVRFAITHELPLYIPRIGCGLGGLDWVSDVEPFVFHLANKYPVIDIIVCDH